jgi:hypothetical protein
MIPSSMPEKIDFLLALPPRHLFRTAVEFANRGYAVGIHSGDPSFTVGWSESLRQQILDLDNENIRFIDMRDFLKAADLQRLDPEQEISRVETKYGLDSMRGFCFAEKCYTFSSDQQLFRKAVTYFRAIERLFDTYEIKCVVQSLGGEIETLAISMVARKRGISVLYPGENLFPNRMILYKDEQLTTNFRLRRLEEAGEDEKRRFHEHLRLFFDAKTVHVVPDKRDWRKKTLHRLRVLFRVMTGQMPRKRLGVFAFYKKEGFLRWMSQWYLYSRFTSDEKYVYFPLHTVYDTQITIRNPQFYQQAFLVEYLSRCLPQGYLLYIKEHPNSVDMPFKWLRFLSRLRNIRILPARVNSHDIVKHARAVVTICSTVGFEALHYAKPVIVLGPNWYLRGKGVTFDVENLADLPHICKLALEAKIDEAKVHDALFSLFSSMYDGSIMTADSTDHRAVVDSFLTKAGELGVAFNVPS